MAEEFAWELKALLKASSLSLKEIIRIGEKSRSVTFPKTSLSDWFNGRSVPSDPAVFRVLVEMLEPLAEKRNQGWRRRSAQEWEQRRQLAARERRQGMGVARLDGAGGGRNSGTRGGQRDNGGDGRGSAADNGSGGGKDTAGGGSTRVAVPEKNIVSLGDAAKAGRVLAALPYREHWLALLRAPEHFPIHITVVEAFQWACRRVRRDIVDSALHEAHTALLAVMAELEQFIGDRMFGPNPGWRWIDLTDYRPDREANLPLLANTRDRPTPATAPWSTR
ncbi:hypothetical protein [Kitasatospora sp. NPDC001175]|uniref:hypothetical protein n=1 Tax=Kitasatospora sp. NPDC001175 TaxID=3157103 RepID=UPI003CFFDB66